MIQLLLLLSMSLFNCLVQANTFHNCSAFIPFNNNETALHPIHNLSTNVSIQMLDRGLAKVQLKDIDLDHQLHQNFSNAIEILNLPFLVQFNNGTIESIEFDENDTEPSSKLIKDAIVSYVWNNKINVSDLLEKCFRSEFDVPLNIAPVNWTEKGFVTPAQDQGECNSCWVFPTIGLLEAYHMNQKLVLMKFSEQRLLNCGRTHRELDLFGCKKTGGGSVYNGIKAIPKDGACLQENEPWQNQDLTCNKKVGYGLYYKGSHFNPKQLLTRRDFLEALTKGPVAAAVFMDKNNFTPWDDFNDTSIMEIRCRAKAPTHAILITGFDRTDTGQEYFMIKNSHGNTWKDKGFGRLDARMGFDSCLSNFVIIQ